MGKGHLIKQKVMSNMAVTTLKGGATNGSWANWQSRRASYESSTAFGDSWNRTWSDSGWSYGDRNSRGWWWYTPVMWVWGETLDDGIHECARRGWLHIDRAFCTWWSEQSECNGSSNSSSSAWSRHENANKQHLVQGKKKQVVVSKRENRAWVTVHLCSMEVSL